MNSGCKSYASDLVRRVEAGDRVTITVAGRSVAVLVPARSRTWLVWDDVVDVFTQPADAHCAEVRSLVNSTDSDQRRR